MSTTLDLELQYRDGGLDVFTGGRTVRYESIASVERPDPWPQVGDFGNPQLGSTYRVREHAGSLQVRMQGELGFIDAVLEPVAPGLYRAAATNPLLLWNHPLFRFLRTDGAPAHTLLYSTDRTRNLRFSRVP